MFSPPLLEILFTHVSRCSRMLEVVNHMIYFALFVFHFREEFKDEPESVDVKTLDIRNFL